ncbi:Glucanosyltransferase-domain-containing protein, partial [Mycena albidolilacea]
QYIKTINVFSKYDNILAFNVGNEVLTADATNAAPFLKAGAGYQGVFVRRPFSFSNKLFTSRRTSISSSALVGYADIDGASSFRDAVSAYLSCDPSGAGKGDTSIDLFGLNNYEWCGDAATTTYDGINKEFANYNVAAYFSEFGSENCSPGVRPWTEVGTLFASPMTDVWSGGLAFSYFPASSAGHEFGMATLSSDNSSVTTNTDFDNLASQYAKVSFVTTHAPARAAQSTFGACPAEGASLAASAALPPTPNDSACACVASKLGCSFKVPANGDLRHCAIRVRLSFFASLFLLPFYELSARVDTSCDFSGNATINPSLVTAPSAAVSQCLPSPSAVFTPTAPAGASSAAGASGTSAAGTGGGGTGGKTGGAMSVRVGLAAAVVCVLGGMGLVWM